MNTVFGRHAAHGFDPDKPAGWWESARCKGVDPHKFEPMPGDVMGNIAALRICAACPGWVKAECLKEALETGDTVTVRGGTTPLQRTQMRRRKATSALKAARRNFDAANAVRLAPRSVCDNGHALTDGNTFVSGDGYVCCKACRADSQREYRHRVAERGRLARELLSAGAR